MDRLEAGLCEVKFDGGESGDKGRFSGYGAVFGNVDSYGDVIRRGAFKDSLREWEERGKWPPMLLQHGGWGIGADDMLPVGRWMSMEENSKGLKVEGQLFAMETERGQYLHEGLHTGALDGLSIGFRVKEFEAGTKPSEPRRTLKAIDLMELSIVTFPANPKARVGSVKSEITVEQMRELEGVLGDRGLSCKDRVKAVSVFKKWLQRDAGEPILTPRDEDVSAELAAKLRRAAEILNARS